MSKKNRAASMPAHQSTPVYDIGDIKAAATGRWVELLAEAGVPGDVLDGRHHPCPRCGGRDRFRLIDAGAGALRCNHCLTDAGDGLASLVWWMGRDFREVLKWVASRLGVTPDRQGDTPVSDPLVAIARHKRVTPESLVAYGAVRVSTRAISLPAYGPDGRRCTTFSIAASGSDRQRKGLFQRGKPAGLFFPHRDGKVQLPQPGEEWLLVEGVKDAAALHSLGYMAAGLNTSHLSPRFARLFAGVKCVIVPDRDKAGLEGASKTASALTGGATSVSVVTLPLEYRETGGGDVRDVLRLPDGETLLRQAISDARDVCELSVSQGDKPLPYEPFPTELLPEPLAAYVRAVAEAVYCDDAYVSLPLLATLAGAIGNSRRIRLKDSWSEPAVLWCVTVGDSGSRKSPGFDAGTWPLSVLQSAEFSRWRDEHSEWEERRRSGGKDFDEPEPQPTRYIVQDSTLEGLAALLESNPRGLLLARDELSGWLAGFDAYRPTAGADVAQWLSIHGARPLIVDRKTGKRITHCPAAAVSICGGIQPAVLARAIQGRGDAEHVENGLLARLLIAYPPHTPKRWTDASVPEGIRQGVMEVTERLVSLEPGEDGRPVEVDLTPGALERFRRFVNEHGQEQARLPGPLRAAWSKLEAYAARLALAAHMVRQVTGDAGTLVDEESIDVGISLARWFGGEAARLYALLGAADDTPEARAERERARLLEWIRRRGGVVTVREVQQGHRRFRTAGDAEMALRELADAGHGRLVVDPPEGRGRPRTVFSVFVDASSTLSTVSTSTEIAETAEIPNNVDVDSVDASVDRLRKSPDDPPWMTDALVIDPSDASTEGGE